MQGENYALSEVPQSARRSMWSLMWALCGFTFFTATMFAGGAVGANFTFEDVIYITVVGYALLASYAIIIGVMAQKTGLTSVLLARYSFGEQGSKIADFLLGATQLGWYAWGTAVVAKILVAMTPIGDDWLYPLMVLCGFLFSFCAYKGYTGIALLGLVGVPLMAVFLGFSIYIATGDAVDKGGLFGIIPATSNMTIDVAITMAFGTFVSGGTQVSNLTRFAKSSKDVVVGVGCAFFIINAFMFVTGAIGAVVYGKPDVVDVLALQGFSLIAVAMLILNIWTTQENGMYNFAVSACNFFRTDNRKTLTIIGAVISTVLAIMGADEFLFSYLILLGTFIPPVGGVLIADYVVRGGKYDPVAEANNPQLNLTGIIAYVLGAGAAYTTAMLSPIVGIVVAFAVYFAIAKMKKQ